VVKVKRSVKVGFGWKEKEHSNSKQHVLSSVLGNIHLRVKSQSAVVLTTQDQNKAAQAYEVEKAETYALLRRQLTFQ
jgi:hypothetical protein